jgi:hypothetical protein
MQTVPTLLELGGLVIFGCCVYVCFTRDVAQPCAAIAAIAVRVNSGS